MDDAVFYVLAIAATLGFILGIVDGWLNTIIVSLLLACLIIWLVRYLS